MKRVVITGMGAVSALGGDVAEMMKGIEQGRSAVQPMKDWSIYKGLHSLVGAPARLKNERLIPRKNRRSMGRLSIFAVQAAEQAVADAGLSREQLTSGRLGCVIGSTMGGASAMNDTFETMLPERDLSQLSSMRFFQCVSHTAAMNVAQHLGITGYVMATSAACASSLQAIGSGFEAIQSGKQDVLLCGEGEELHPLVTASFDILFATSTHYNDNAALTPRPFDEKRDGLVVGEGSGILVLEAYEHAKARGAKMYGEIRGYATCGSGNHISQSHREGMRACLEAALADAKIEADGVDYINAHATATLQGDRAEAEAIRDVFGGQTPVSALKGHLGHTLGSSGAIELIASLIMMERSVIYPTRNLETVSKDCRGIMHVQTPIQKKINVMVKNCFAFGGINASLVCSRNGAGKE